MVKSALEDTHPYCCCCCFHRRKITDPIKRCCCGRAQRLSVAIELTLSVMIPHGIVRRSLKPHPGIQLENKNIKCCLSPWPHEISPQTGNTPPFWATFSKYRSLRNNKKVFSNYWAFSNRSRHFPTIQSRPYGSPYRSGNALLYFSFFLDFYYYVDIATTFMSK